MAAIVAAGMPIEHCFVYILVENTACPQAFVLDAGETNYLTTDPEDLTSSSSLLAHETS